VTTCCSRWRRERIRIDGTARRSSCNRSRPDTERSSCPGGTDARYVPTGHLVYGRSDTTYGSGTLFAVRLDAARMTVGSAAPLIDGVRTASSRPTGALQFDLSASGTLAYVPGSRVGPEFGKQQLGVADRTGQAEPLPVPPDRYRAVRVSPEGSSGWKRQGSPRNASKP
jgi:hypothetical protein